ncbi:hypothetical protein LTS10_005851 [Elasticomyces elasticus]|nr:hypothetical protein LTS10_005851 [Elasticomyces elasticus]
MARSPLKENDTTSKLPSTEKQKAIDEYVSANKQATARLNDVKQHQKAIQDHALRYSDNYQILLDMLNRCQQVALFELEEFESRVLTFTETVDSIRAGTGPEDVEGILSFLFDAVLIECAKAINVVRAAMAKVADLADGLARKAAFQGPDVDDLEAVEKTISAAGEELDMELVEAESNAIQFYSAVIMKWRSVITSNRADRDELDKNYPASSSVVQESEKLSDHEEGFQNVLMKIKEALSRSAGMLDKEAYRREWMDVKHILGGAYARKAVAGFDGIEISFQACVETAKMAFPEDFREEDAGGAK